MMIQEIISKILAGGFVGYITNDIAIRMLFEEFFKVKIGDKTYSLGGLIVKKRLEFQASISDLVERKVIHDQALIDEFNKLPFDTALEALLTSLLQKTLPETFDVGQRWGDIPAIERFFEGLHGALGAHLQPLQQEVLPALLAELRPNGLLTAEQTKPVADKLLTAGIDALENAFPTELLTQILQHLAQKSLREIVPDAVQTELFALIDRLTPNIPQWLQHQLHEELEELLQKGWELLRVEDFLQHLVAHFAEQPLANLLHTDNRALFLENLTGKVRTIFQTDVREDVVEVLLKYIFQVLQEDKTPLYNLLSPQMYEALVQFLAEKLPPLLKGLQKWIGNKKHELDTTIQTAFQENAGVVVQVLAAVFVGNVGKAVGIDEKIIRRIDSLDVHELAQELTNRLETFLKNTSVGELLRKIPQDRIIDALSPLINTNLQRAIPNLKLDNLAQWLERPINQFFDPQEISQMLLTRLRGVFMKRVQTDFLYTDKLATFLQGQFREGLNRILDAKATQTGEETRFFGTSLPEVAENIRKWGLAYLRKHQDSLATRLAEGLHTRLAQMGALKLSENQQKRVGERLTGVLLDFLQREYDRLKAQSVRDSLRLWLGDKGWEQDLAARLKRTLIANLPDLTKGRIKALVASSLAKQEDSKMRDMVYKAMGQELAPLNWFGAGLGLLTGIVLLLMPVFPNFWANISIVALAYGITGWGTNWVAVKMLFRPHYPIKMPLLGRTLPFTPGVIAKNKRRFAGSMGRFIGDRLLDKASLHANFAENRGKLQGNITEIIQKDDYSLLQDAARKHQGTWAHQIGQFALENLRGNAPKIGEKLAQILLQNNPKSLAGKQLEGWTTDLEARTRSEDFLQWAVDALLRQLERYFAQKETLADVLPARWLEDLPRYVHQLLQKIVGDLPTYLQNVDWLRVFALQKLAPQVEKWLEQDLDGILTKEQEENLKERVYEFLKKQLQNESVKNLIFKFLDERLRAEFSANRQINEVMGGRIMDLIQNNLNLWLTQGVDSVLEWLKDNRNSLVEEIYKNVEAQYAGTWLVKTSIIKTSQALIDDGIPSFFEKELNSLKIAVEEQMHLLGATPFNLLTSQLLHADNLQERVQAMTENAGLFRKVQQLANLLLEERIFKIPLGQFLPIEASALLRHLESLLLPETVLLTEHLLRRLEAREEVEQWLQTITPVASGLLTKVFLSVKPHILLEALQQDKAHLLALLRELLSQKYAVGEARTAGKILLDFLSTHLLERPLGDWFEEAVIAQNVSNTVGELLDKPALHSLLKAHLTALVEKLLAHLATHLQTETKDFLLAKLSDALFDALDDNIEILLASVDFKDIVVREIDKMHARELEALFYGFAGMYFRFIIGYGFIFGIIFGFLVDFTVLALALWLLG